jgi:hypothetical protein
MTNGPWWVRAIGVTGVTGAIALYLIHFLTTSLAAAIERHDQTTAERLRELITISRQICVNGAISDVEREGCLR